MILSKERYNCIAISNEKEFACDESLGTGQKLAKRGEERVS
jgi:hypothetical protein